MIFLKRILACVLFVLPFAFAAHSIGIDRTTIAPVLVAVGVSVLVTGLTVACILAAIYLWNGDK